MTTEGRRPTPIIEAERLPLPITVPLADGTSAVGIETESIDGERKTFRWLQNIPVSTGFHNEFQRKLAIIMARWKLVLKIDTAIGLPIDAKKSEELKSPTILNDSSVLGLYVDASVDLSNVRYTKMPKWHHQVSRWKHAEHTVQKALKHTPQIKFK